MSAAVIRFNELHQLPRRTLVALAIKAAADVDRGDDKRALVDRILGAVARKTTECPQEAAS